MDTFKIGDSVRVKAGVVCPDDEHVSIAGWQGRVFEIDQDDDGTVLIGIQWDSITLAALPDAYIKDCEEQGCECDGLYLEVGDLEPAQARDTEEEAVAFSEMLEEKAFWIGNGEQGQRILEIIGTISPDEMEKRYEAWESHMGKVLTFPFDAVVCEPQDDGPVDEGDEVQAVSLAGIDGVTGVLVNAKHGSEELVFPLCDLDVRPPESPSYQPVEDYREWYDNS